MKELRKESGVTGVFFYTTRAEGDKDANEEQENEKIIDLPAKSAKEALAVVEDENHEGLILTYDGRYAMRVRREQYPELYKKYYGIDPPTEQKWIIDGIPEEWRMEDVKDWLADKTKGAQWPGAEMIRLGPTYQEGRFKKIKI